MNGTSELGHAQQLASELVDLLCAELLLQVDGGITRIEFPFL
jgi:hypothetical protein